MKIFFATSNAAKVTSVARVLGSYGIEVGRADIDLPELQAETAKAVAAPKAIAAFAAIKAPVIVVDSALHIDALGGFPGTYVKWATKQLGLQGYLDLLARHASPEARTCRFVDALAYMDGMWEQPQIFVREERGRIALAPAGDPAGHKSPTATVFIPEGCDKTIAEMSAEEFTAYRTRPSTEGFYRELAGWLTGTVTGF